MKSDFAEPIYRLYGAGHESGDKVSLTDRLIPFSGSFGVCVIMGGIPETIEGHCSVSAPNELSIISGKMFTEGETCSRLLFTFGRFPYGVCHYGRNRYLKSLYSQQHLQKDTIRSSRRKSGALYSLLSTNSVVAVGYQAAIRLRWP